MCDCLNSLYPPNGSAIICGDFNFPSIDWSTDNCLYCSKSTCSGIFLEFYYAHGMRQIVTEPTRVDHTLDLVFCNDDNCVLNCKVLEPFSTSDHNQICFDILYNTAMPHYEFSSHDFNHADWIQIKAHLEGVDFFQLFQCQLPPLEVFEQFYKVIYECFDLFVPLKRVVISERPQKHKYPRNIQRLICRKANAWRNYRAFKTPESLASYKKLASQCRAAIYSHVLSRENQLIEKGNLGKFFQYANKKFCSKSSVGALHRSDGSLTMDSKEKRKSCCSPS